MNLWLKEVDITHLKFQGRSDFTKFFKNKVEDEKRLIFECILYDVERKNLELWFSNFLNVDFPVLSSDNPVIHIYILDFVFACVKKRMEYLNCYSN